MKNVTFLSAGEGALVVEFGKDIDEKINMQVQQLTEYMEKANISGIREILPTYRSLMIFFDPMVINYMQLVKKMERLELKDISLADQKKRILQVPCLYDGEDMADMEKITKLSRDEIIQIHSQTDYRIYMLGFLPGFVYLGGLDKRIHAPRLQSPRVKIESGSVGIGGSQTGIYPVQSPGGWRLLGRTPLKMYDVNRKEPILCKAGEYIRFVPVSNEEFEAIRQDVDAGSFVPEWIGWKG